MPPPKKKLQVLPDFRDENGRPGFALRKWDGAKAQYVLVSVPVTQDELKTQLSEPVRLSNEPKYWLYRNRFVLEEGAASESDEFIDLLESVVKNDDADRQQSAVGREATIRKKAEELERLMREAGIPLLRSFDLENVVRRAMMGLLPKRHSEVVNQRPDELVLRVKHAVLTEEKALDRLRREVEAFENFEKIRATPREPIPEHIRMFVWQRDGGRCAKCGCRERLEFDHIIPLAGGGSNTERNIQLLCESCNRTKGAVVS